MSDNISKQPAYAMLPTLETVTEQHVDVLLNILDGLKPFVLTEPRDIGTSAPELDGGVASAAVSTFIRVAGKLDEILGDEKRWKLDKMASLHQELITTQRFQQKFLYEQTLSAKELRRPSYIHRPHLFQSEGKFLAISGRVDVPGAYILGQGDTPALALHDYDEAFKRAPQEQLQMIFESEPAPEPIPPTPATFKPKPKKK